MTKSFKNKKNGFTLIEMMVAVFVFSIVMVLATGAIFSIVNANKTSQALKSVMDNLSSALDSMSRNIRYGSIYHCSGGNPNTPQSCPEGDVNGLDNTVFAFHDRNGVQIIYEFLPDDDNVPDGPGYINRCIGSTDPINCSRLTAFEVHINNLNFYVQGAEPSDAGQPEVLITITGYAQAGVNKSDFNIETMVDQRNLMCKQSMHELKICKYPDEL